jgi:hypothetical protein
MTMGGVKGTGVLLVATLLVATACTAGHRHADGQSGQPSAPVAPATSSIGFTVQGVNVSGFPGTSSPLLLRGGDELTFRTLGSSNCYWTPQSLERTGDSQIQIDLHWPSVHICLDNRTGHTFQLKLLQPLPTSGALQAVLRYPAIGKAPARVEHVAVQRI